MSPGRWGEPGCVGCVQAGCRSLSRGHARAGSHAGAGCRGTWELVGSSSSSVEAHAALSPLSADSSSTVPSPPSQAPTAGGNRVAGTGVGIWCRNHCLACLLTPRPQVLVLPRHPERFPYCRQWAGRVARPPHWCVPMPAAGRGARTGLRECRAGQGAAGAPGAALLAAAWARREINGSLA